MSRIEAAAAIAAPVALVWDVLVDVEDWPRWTESMTSVRRLDDGPLRVGSSARIEQPRMRPMVWTVTELVPLQTFTWTTRAPGITIAGIHRVHAEGGGATRLELAAVGSGPLAGIADLLAGRRTRRYVQLEAAGIKAAAEAVRPTGA
jgi:uncharacterized membrane protein